MKVSMLAVGKRMPVWVQQGVDDYSRRLPRHWRFTVREIPQASGSAAAERMHREGERLLDALSEPTHLVCLDVTGSAWSTVTLADQLARWQGLGKSLTFVIGGPDGLHERCVARADQRWSLSALTFPHPLVRVILLEQLYRAHSLASGHPYHRA